ncbi:MAG: hypothetical protein WAO02_10650 [Verrucomicrobiia bacterium]
MPASPIQNDWSVPGCQNRFLLRHNSEPKTSKPPDYGAFLSWYATRYVSTVPGTKDSNLLRRLSVSKPFLWLLVLLPSVAAISVFGQKSVITLAMVSYDQAPAGTAAVAAKGSTANALGDTSAPLLQYRITGLKLDHQNIPCFSTNSLFDQRDGSLPGNWSRFVYKKATVDGRTAGWMHVEAGYGQYCQFESSFGENAWQLERPSCAYFRACFSF